MRGVCVCVMVGLLQWWWWWLSRWAPGGHGVKADGVVRSTAGHEDLGIVWLPK